MNKYFLILGVLLIAGISFAQISENNPYLDAKLGQVYCQRQVLLPGLRSAASGYSSTYTSQINSALSNVASSIPNLREACMLNEVSGFNSEYTGEFIPASNTVRALFFRSAFEYYMNNYPSYSWNNVMNQYYSILSSYQSCVNNHPIYHCNPAST